MENGRVVIAVVSSLLDGLASSVKNIIDEVFTGSQPLVSCMSGTQLVAVHDKIRPDLVIITNFNLGEITAADLVRQFPDDKFIVYYDVLTDQQVSQLGVPKLHKLARMQEIAVLVAEQLSNKSVNC